MKKFLLMSIALLAVVGTAFGQGGAPKSGAPTITPEMKKQMDKMREERYKQIAKELKLTPDQLKKMRAADDKVQAKAMKILQGPGEQQTKMPKLMALQGEVMAEYKKFLKPNQYKKFEEIANKQRAAMQKMGAPKGGGGN
jgi:Spy/CpxP family protein refolding chaperone